jgi:enoyl-CoA hydratase
LNAGTLAEFDQLLGEVRNNSAIRALLLTGSGDRAFVAGADISEFAAFTPISAQRQSEKGQTLFRQLETLGKPVLAALNGFTLGGGLEMAMACTVRVAAENAQLGQPEVKLGIIAGYGGSQRLPRLVGKGIALEMLLTGEPISAQRAYAIGLVNYVVPAPELLSFSRQLLLKMLANAPLALALTIQAVDVGLNGSLADGLQFEAATFGLSAATQDMQEGVAAFLAKRPAHFQGK